MHPQFQRRFVGPFLGVLLAAFVAGCDHLTDPTPPDVGFTFNGCASISGVFTTSSFEVTSLVRPRDSIIVTGNPALVVSFVDGRFTATTFASGLPPITNVGSFSITGGYVIFGERPLVPHLSTAGQRFGCQLTASQLILVNNTAMFDFGTGRFDHATMRAELTRR